MKRIFLIIIIFSVASSGISAQSPDQTIRGTVIDVDTQLPLIGATIVVMDSDPLIGTATQSDGTFTLENIPIGRIGLQISYLGYRAQIIPNIEVNSAKEVVLDIRMEEATEKMAEIVVQPGENRGDPINDMAIISARSVSAAQTSRYAGGFNDPSKITSNFAGVATSHDGGNEIIVRGNSPKYIQWRLEGTEITNPNHFGDQNAISGIVGALNNNILSTSDFYTGAFPAEFGDALSGVYDIRMRRGNNEKFEGIFGLGILGTDLTAEGPFKKGYQGSYLVNFRYSTVGLITDLGLTDVEGVNLSFQDAAWKFWLPTQRAGVFSVFGLQGNSGFTFEDVDPGVWVTPGEDFQSGDLEKDYEKGAQLFNTGINHTINVSPRAFMNSSIAFSLEGIRDDVYEYDSETNTQEVHDFNGKNRKTALQISSVYNYKLSASNKLKAGVKYRLHNQRMDQSQLNEHEQRISLLDFSEQIGVMRSFISWKFQPTDRFTLVSGLHNTNVFLNGEHTVEPRLSLNYAITQNSNINLGYGHHSRMESVHNYFAHIQNSNGVPDTPNENLELLKAHHFVAGFEHYLSSNLRVELSTYYQYLYDVPVENDVNSSYSTLNEGLELNYVDLVNEGTGKNYGVELTVERFLSNGFYVLTNASFYESKYMALDEIERNTRHNGKYLFNILAGKEFRGIGRKGNQVLSLDAKAFFGGGRYIVPLLRDENGNAFIDKQTGSVYDYDRAYQQKLDDITNIIFSISYKWNRSNVTHELYLNIDNLTNNRARLREFYDARAVHKVSYERKVAILPNLLYKIYF